jgi:hypothetical protein
MKNSHKGVKVVRTEPVDMHLFETKPMEREVFQRMGCLSFYQNMQRGHPEVTRKFSLHFYGWNTKVGDLDIFMNTKVGDLEFEVIEDSISSATKIPITSEKWFKAMDLNAAYAKDFLKPKHQDGDLSKGVPRNQLIEQFDKILRII